MRTVLQRVSSASVTIDRRVTAQIGPGLLVFVAIESADSPADGEWLAQKIARLRIFPDDAGQMNQSVNDIAGAILLVSQFTLHASTQKGTRPSFHAAAPPALARPLYETFITQLSTALGRPVQTGKFGSLMQVALVNDGPVTLLIDSQHRE